MRAIDAHVTLDVLTKILANLGENGFITYIPHGAIGEVSVHSRTVSVGVAEWLGVVVYRKTIFLSGSPTRALLL